MRNGPKEVLQGWIEPGFFQLKIKPIQGSRVRQSLVKQPGKLGRLALLVREAVMNIGRVLVCDLRLEVLRWAGPDWSVTYIGEGMSAETIASMLFPEPPELKERSQIRLWQAPGRIHTAAAHGDLVVCELNEIIQVSRAGLELAFSTPCLVQQVIEGIDRPTEEILADIDQHTRSRIRRLETQGYAFELSRSVTDFDEFYRRMYVPYASARFNGRGARVRKYTLVREHFTQGVLIRVRRGVEWIGGGVTHLIGDLCKAEQLGVLDGRYDLVKDGVNVALWWFVLLWARGQGARRYDLGSSLPYLANGVFTFKRQWGARVFANHDNHVGWHFFGKNLPSRLCDFLNHQGLITEVKGKMYQVVLDPDEPADRERLEARMKVLTRMGLAGMAAVDTGGGMRLIAGEEVIGKDGGKGKLEG
jgi:hypothetical protein